MDTVNRLLCLTRVPGCRRIRLRCVDAREAREKTLTRRAQGLELLLQRPGKHSGHESPAIRIDTMCIQISEDATDECCVVYIALAARSNFATPAQHMCGHVLGDCADMHVREGNTTPELSLGTSVVSFGHSVGSSLFSGSGVALGVVEGCTDFVVAKWCINVAGLGVAASS